MRINYRSAYPPGNGGCTELLTGVVVLPAEAIASRKTVFRVKCLKEASRKGSQGGLAPLVQRLSPTEGELA